jgi:transcriptional regulator with XRE-family HTH domain
MNSMIAPIGDLLRTWRGRRRMSQLALASEANISQRHLSFIESGRASPSREMVLHLAERLDVPARDRNALLMTAGFAPIFQCRALADPALESARSVIDLILEAHVPHPALAVDRHWTMTSANAAVAPLLSGVDPELLKPPVNVMRVSLHPRGMAPLIVNLAQWRGHLLERLRRQWSLTRDPVIDALLTEVSSYPAPTAERRERPARDQQNEIAVPLRLRTHAGVLSLLSTVTVFGTPVEITLSELSIEAFYPADAATAELLGARANRRSETGARVER